MTYVLRLRRDGVELTRLAATAVEAVVIAETYAANGFESGPFFREDGRSQLTLDDLKAEASSGEAAIAAETGPADQFK